MTGAHDARLARTRAAILRGARTVFAAAGYERARMDEVARHAGVSKGTLYNHFANKDALFVAYVEDTCRTHAARLVADGVPMGAPADVLGALGARVVTLTLAPEVVALLRVLYAETPSHPHLGALFEALGPAIATRHIAGVLVDLDARGAVRVPDPPAAAAQFLQLCLGELLRRVLLSLDPPPSAHDVAARVEGAVTLFLRAYGVAVPTRRFPEAAVGGGP